VLIIVSVLTFVPSHHASAKYVFTSTFNDTGFHSIFYVLLLGLLLAQYTFTGYDASAHMTEETHGAARSGPRGIVMSILVSLFAGWILLIGITFAIGKSQYSRDLSALVPPAQVFTNAIGATGAIRLDEGGSVAEAGLQLLVGFKGAEPSILDPYTQSGGERSVALVAFMLSLQSRIISPIRAMDEFDIHMDPRNREAIFKMILAQGKRNPNSQNIVITPSIITVADRTAHVITVQSVHGSSQVKEYASGR
jgi:hypothetical protein